MVFRQIVFNTVGLAIWLSIITDRDTPWSRIGELAVSWLLGIWVVIGIKLFVARARAARREPK